VYEYYTNYDSCEGCKNFLLVLLPLISRIKPKSPTDVRDPVRWLTMSIY
jgi:hypothetical protein